VTALGGADAAEAIFLFSFVSCHSTPLAVRPRRAASSAAVIAGVADMRSRILTLVFTLVSSERISEVSAMSKVLAEARG